MKNTCGHTPPSACAALLVGAVGITWYGPPRAEPALLVNTGTGSVCGSVAGVSAGILMLETADGENSIWLDSVLGMRPVDSCP